MILKEEILKYIENNGLSLRKVAEKCNYDHSVIYRLTKSSLPNIYTLNNIIKSLNQYLIFDNEIITSYNSIIDNTFKYLILCDFENAKNNYLIINEEKDKIMNSILKYRFILVNLSYNTYFRNDNTEDPYLELEKNINKLSNEDQKFFYDCKGIQFVDSTRWEKAIKSFKKGLAIHGDKIFDASLHYHMVRPLTMNKFYIQASESADKAYDIFSDLGINNRSLYCLQKKAIITKDIDDHKKSINTYLKLIPLAKKYQMKDLLKDSYNNLLWIYAKKDLDINELDMIITQLNNDDSSIIDHKICFIIAYTMYKRQKYAISLNWIERAKGFRKEKDIYHLITIMIEAIIIDDYEKATSSAVEILDLCTKEDDEEKEITYNLLIDVYKAQNDQDKLLEINMMLRDLNKE